MPLYDEIQKVLSKHSENYAIIFRDSKNGLKGLTYSEINGIAEQFYHLFEKNNVRNNCIGLMMDHNLFIPSIIISLQRLDCAFIFFNKRCRESNVRHLISELGISWILSFERNEEHKDIPIECRRKETITLYGSEFNLYHTRVDSIFHVNICYVIQTSGTTGDEAKLVYVENECIRSNIVSLRDIFKITSSDTIYFGTPLTFDPSMVELFLGLFTGATLVITSQEDCLNHVALLSVLFPNTPKSNQLKKKVTVLQMCPSVFLRWTQSQMESAFECLRILALGGEKFPTSILRYSRSPYLKIYNLYGITEVSCWASVQLVEGFADEVPLGSCLNDTEFEIRRTDESLDELYIGSSKRFCYLKNENRNLGQALFRPTGDIVRKVGDNIYFEGRINSWVKRNGVRVNLDWIETTILRKAGANTISVWNKDTSKISLFIESKGDKKFRDKLKDKLRVDLLHLLPKESFPDYIHVISKLPLTQNGKVDKKLLSNFKDFSEYSGRNLGEIFEQIWGSYLGLDPSFYQDKRFMECGGNSILLLQFLDEFSQYLQHDCPVDLVNLVFENSLRKCKEYLMDHSKQVRKRMVPFSADEDILDIHQRKTLKKKLDKNCRIKVKWTYNMDACVDASPTIFHYNGMTLVAVGAFSRIFVIIDVATGEIISSIVLGGSIENASRILPNGAQLCVGCHDGSMYCLNVETCQIVWQYETNDTIKNVPCLCLNEKAVVFGSFDKNVYCLATKDGELLWKTYMDGSIRSDPIHLKKSKNVCVANLLGDCFCLDETDGSIIWKYSAKSPIFGNISEVNDFLILPEVQGKLHCIIQKTGVVLSTSPKIGQIFSNPLVIGNIIIVNSVDKHVYIFEFSQEKLTLTKKLSLEGTISASSDVVELENNKYIVVVLNSGEIILVDIINFDVFERLALPGDIFSSPKVVGNKVLVGCRDNNLYCLEINR